MKTWIIGIAAATWLIAQSIDFEGQSRHYYRGGTAVITIDGVGCQIKAQKYYGPITSMESATTYVGFAVINKTTQEIRFYATEAAAASACPAK